MDTGYNDKAIFHPNIQEESLFQTPLWAITIRYWMFFYLGEYYSFQNVGRPCSSNRLIRVIPRLLVRIQVCCCASVKQISRIPDWFFQRKREFQNAYQRKQPQPAICTKL